MNIFSAVRHYLIYAMIAAHVAGKYLFRLSPAAYLRFLRRAGHLLWAFRHNRVIKTTAGYKLQLYLPAYPSPAFFEALENKLLKKPPAPTSVVFSMTRACSYACPHCYQKTERGADLPEEVLLETLRQVRQTGVTYFNIEGGEPFLRPERLATILQALDASCEIWVNTTGHAMTEALLKQLKALGLKGLMFSIHSPDPTIHDSFTGVPGSFAAAGQAMAICKRNGLGLAINSVLSEQELRGGQLPRLMELGKELRADFIQLIHPKPCGGWLEKTDGLQQDEDVLRLVEREHLYYNSWRTAGYPSLASQVFEERSAGVGCTAGGIDRFYITATGEVQPCEFLQISFGNVQEEAFAAIFARMRQEFAIPRRAWLCCEQRQAIVQAMAQNHLGNTPLPWQYTRALAGKWSQGEPTPLYKQLGIYES